MQILVTPAQMSEMEKRFLAEASTSSLALMERAASEVSQALLERFGPGKRAFFACGPGGNGGDGLAAARLYQEAGGRSAILLLEPPRSPDARENHRRAREAGVEELSPNSKEKPDVWVDALFGTGLSRAPEGRAGELIARMRRDSVPIVSVDIPSGISGLSGQRLGEAVRATFTVTFQYAKVGHFLNDGLDCAGELLVKDIGIPQRLAPEGAPLLLDLAAASWKASQRNIHKGGRGHVLIVAGSFGMAGAAALAAGAALRGGAGLVTVACPKSIVPILQALEPCAMCLPLPEREGALSPEAARPLENALAGKDCVAVGPGLSRRFAPEIVEAALACGLPAVFDADALNLLAEHPSLLAKLDSRHTLTPHPGEAKRLLRRELFDPLSDARALSQLGGGAKVVLKGASRVLAFPTGAPLFLSATGSAGMAKGGSGDVFTGLLAALLARRERDFCAEAAACEIHGLAGVLAQNQYGEMGMTAQNIVEMLPEAFRRTRWEPEDAR